MGPPRLSLPDFPSLTALSAPVKYQADSFNKPLKNRVEQSQGFIGIATGGKARIGLKVLLSSYMVNAGHLWWTLVSIESGFLKDAVQLLYYNDEARAVSSGVGLAGCRVYSSASGSAPGTGSYNFISFLSSALAGPRL